ncbi:V-type ATP synthase subunit E [Thermotoga neapolitana]|uniref:V-ATPase E-subunit n=2 Tax=Thermotoga neapolitana TaxID=2337 RepID=B9K812_THENN|nr:V-type ATP synthase subunit E [Thermotoga neapolitana]ACM23095.1 V-ATPase E-subunit [Thermotoga neapolitana DSM 4359]KFZ21904.1 V-ATPase E-subunit [Thermotoga neapolitana LA10]BAC22094.1 V-ATPase E-subunit [Thermotoga neapolitana DSM 4359]HBF11624.1 ATPase [Thermotoga neapolitana]
MSENDIEAKLETFFAVFRKRLEEKKEELRKKYEQLLNAEKERIEKEIVEFETSTMKKAEMEAKRMIDKEISKLTAELRREKIIYKNKLITEILSRLKEKLMNLPPERKKLLYKKLYEEARRVAPDENFTVYCNPNDLGIVSEIVGGEKIVSDPNVREGILLKKDRMLVRSTIDTFLEDRKEAIYDIIVKKVGEI